MKNRFKQLNDGDYLDNKTGLIWKQFPEDKTYTYDEAIKVDFGDYRLPTINELKEVISKKKHNRVYTKILDMPLVVWSSSTSVYNNDNAWTTNFEYGQFDSGYRNFSFGVRLVRKS